MRRLILCGLFLVAACGKDAPVAPTPAPTPPPAPVIAACEANKTAVVAFQNTSKSTTQTVVWDGFTVATLGPGELSDSRTVAAGVAHTSTFKIANTNLLACATAQPVPATCSMTTFTCAFPN